MPTIMPSIWYSREAEEAANFYASIFPNSRVERVSTLPVESPSGPAGTVKIVEFTLLGQPFEAFSAGPLDQFNHSISLSVRCDTQEEIDRYWDALLEGGTPEQCGWLKDRYGLSWQIVPKVLATLLTDPDPEKAKRAGEAMLRSVKFDIAELERAAAGEARVS
jgi:predicted 3-demethylubiquinone-9 3-methyltransferase (glyoxalase superfamily)